MAAGTPLKTAKNQRHPLKGLNINDLRISFNPCIVVLSLYLHPGSLVPPAFAALRRGKPPRQVPGREVAEFQLAPGGRVQTPLRNMESTAITIRALLQAEEEPSAASPKNPRLLMPADQP
jgi:hypothetical protein